MTVYEIIHILSQDKIALSLLSMVLLLSAFGTSKVAKSDGNRAPYSYVFSVVIFGACIVGVLSLVLWLHAIVFDQKGLWQLDFFVFYLPIITMLSTIGIVRKSANFGQLPWFGELYELLTMIFVSFGLIVITIEKEIFNFNSIWHVIIFFLLLFGLLKTAWEKFSKVR